ncbi:hypothetical protein C5706_16230 [Klebsiella pneumoniae]|nr:hypothetical protein C5706_16230 [Klebsiella pneumoniae]
MMPIPNRDAVALSARTLGALFSYAPNSAEIAPLIRRQPPRATGLLIGLLLVLIAECIGRGLFYGLHMTVGMAVAG